MLPFTRKAAGSVQAASSSGTAKHVSNNSPQGTPSSSCDLWYVKYAPTDLSACAMHKTKQSAIKAWLVSAFSGAHDDSMGPPILALVGVSGSAKSTTVELLCKEMGVAITPWTEDMWGSSSYDGWQRASGHGRHGYNARTGETGVETQFENFAVSQGMRQLPTSGGAHSSSSQRRIVLVHDPPEMRKDSEAFASALTAFGSPIVLIVSTSTEGRDDAHFSVDNLLPTSVKSRSNFQSIYCQPIASTLLAKALERVLQLSKINTQRELKASKDQTKAALKEIATLSLGDLRNAIINLEFRCASKTLVAPQGWASSYSSCSSQSSSQSSSKKRKLSSSSSTGGAADKDDGGDGEGGVGDGEAVHEASQSREVLFSPLHAMAKLLSAKLDLSGRAKYKSLEQIMDKCDFSSESALLFLQYNCVQHVEEDSRLASFGVDPAEILRRSSAGQLKEPMRQLDDLLTAYSDVDLFIGNKAAAVSKGVGLAEQVAEARAERYAKSFGLLAVRKPKVFSCMRVGRAQRDRFLRFRDLLSETYYGGNYGRGNNNNGNYYNKTNNDNNSDDDACTNVLLLGLDQVVTAYAPLLGVIASAGGAVLPRAIAAMLPHLHADGMVGGGGAMAAATGDGSEETAEVLRADDIAEFND